MSGNLRATHRFRRLERPRRESRRRVATPFYNNKILRGPIVHWDEAARFLGWETEDQLEEQEAERGEEDDADGDAGGEVEGMVRREQDGVDLEVAHA